MRIAHGAGRLHARPGRRAAQGHGQEGPQGHGQAARGSSSTGAQAKGINEKKATKIFDLMEHFAGYGFNKSHSTAYAFLAYQTAYLKANYPRHFAAALLTIEAQNTDKLALYLAECRERGIAGAAAGHQREPAALHGGARGRALRPDRDQGRSARARSTSILEVRARARAHHLAARALRGARPAPGQQAGARGLVKSGACDSLVAAPGVHAAPPAARGCSAPSTAPSSTAAARSATAITARPTCSAAATRRRAVAIIRLPDVAAVDRDGAARASRRRRSASI